MIYQLTSSYHEETAIENSHTVLSMELSKKETNFNAVLNTLSNMPLSLGGLDEVNRVAILCLC